MYKNRMIQDWRSNIFMDSTPNTRKEGILENFAGLFGRYGCLQRQEWWLEFLNSSTGKGALYG